jgi:flagellar motor switch protein FliG
MKTNANLRKAAVLLRSVDADTAATLLSQLSVDETAALREAVRVLGPVDPDEQADVLSEFRRQKPPVSELATSGVELSLSSTDQGVTRSTLPVGNAHEKRFDFLDGAPAKKLASYLAREHAQTIAVVLSHLPPERAVAVLAALPEKTQAETVERLSNLGDTDSEAVAMLETELAEWLKSRTGVPDHRGYRRDAAISILAAADATTRDAIIARLKSRDPELARQIQPMRRERPPQHRRVAKDEYRVVRSTIKRPAVNTQLKTLMSAHPAAPEPAKSPPHRQPAPPPIDFDQLIHMDSRMLAQLLEVADPNLLALALAGSKDELVERVCDQMPKRIAKAFRRELRRMGPTRLSDVDAAQRAIADLAARQIASRRAVTMHLSQLQNV